jgi:hypothetical protein
MRCLQTTDLEKSMFPYKFALSANDKLIERYLLLARQLGLVGIDWTYGWGDAGRVTFAFDSREMKQAFYNFHFLFQP